MAMAGFGVPLGIILIAATTLTGFGQDRDLYNQEPVEVLRVAEADFQFVQAVAHSDTAGVEKVLDADFTWTSADGAVHSRSEVLHQLPKTAILNEKDEESLESSRMAFWPMSRRTGGDSTCCECG